MAEVPQLLEEDVQQFTLSLDELLTKSEANFALLVEKAGYLIHQCGDFKQVDTTNLATLASNSFAATEYMMANTLSEPAFSGMYIQGEEFSTLVTKIDESFLLVVIFKAHLSVGAVKYFAGSTIQRLATQLEIARHRTPGVGYDLIDLNTTDVGALFKKNQG